MTPMAEETYREMRVAYKKFVSQKEGAALYSMGVNTFRKIAEEANAIYRVGGKMILVNTEIFEEYLETFRVWR